MPSPVGHAIAGAIVAFARSTDEKPISTGLVIGCVALACAPDLDLILFATHRTATHSVLAVAVVFAVTRWLARNRVGGGHMATTCAAAYASHIVLDLAGVDRGEPAGLQLFWPVVSDWYQTPWPFFLGTDRRAPFERAALQTNLKALTWELMVLVPILLLLIRRRRQIRP